MNEASTDKMEISINGYVITGEVDDIRNLILARDSIREIKEPVKRGSVSEPKHNYKRLYEHQHWTEGQTAALWAMSVKKIFYIQNLERITTIESGDQISTM